MRLLNAIFDGWPSELAFLYFMFDTEGPMKFMVFLIIGNSVQYWHLR